MYRPTFVRPRGTFNAYSRDFHDNSQWRPNFDPRGFRRGQQTTNWNSMPTPPQQNYNRNRNITNSDEYWCETCDRGFSTLDLLNSHKQQHQKCNIDGCQFIAHPKVITKHIQMQHSTGLFKKIHKLDNPEAINKWIEERKKKYPTQANIEKKNAEIKEKIERGEKMGFKPDRKVKDFHTRTKPGLDFSHQQKFKKNLSTSSLPHKSPQNIPPINKRKKMLVQKKVHESLPLSSDKRKLKPFAGIQDIIMENHIEEEIKQDVTFSIEDDEIQQPSNKDTLKIDEPIVCSALTSLMCSYGSSDEENDIKPNNTTRSPKSIKIDSIINEVTNNDSTKHETQENQEIDNDSGPEECKVAKIDTFENHDTAEKLENCNTTKKKIFNGNKLKTSFKKPKPKLPSTLLVKLLSKEMRQERNIVLQCIRHIVKNNYFDRLPEVMEGTETVLLC